MRKSIVTDGIAAFFLFLFLYAALAKLTDYTNFRLQLAQSPLLYLYAGSIAWMIPALEIIIGCLLFFPRGRIIGLYASFSLMILFTAYIIAITRFSEYIPCSCGGLLSTMSWNQHLVFNIAATLLAAIACWLYATPASSISPPSLTISPSGTNSLL